MTPSQKADAYDELKKSLIAVKNDIYKSAECRQMAIDFIVLVAEVENKIINNALKKNKG